MSTNEEQKYYGCLRDMMSEQIDILKPMEEAWDAEENFEND